MHDSTTTHGLWAETAPRRPDLASLGGDHTTDVAIIGGGYTGLSAALHLSQAGQDCLLLDAEEIGFGGAGRNAGLVNAGLWLMPEKLLRLAGPLYGERVLQVLGASPDLVFRLIDEHKIECEARRNGTLHCADSKKGLRELQQREAQWLKRGAPVKLLDRDAATEKTGSHSFLGALLDERTGTIQPLSYALGLAHAALKSGARLFVRSPVTEHQKTSQGYVLTTPGGTVKAKAVIVAVHAYPLFAFEPFKRSMISMNYFQFSTPPLSPEILNTVLPERQGAWDTNLILSSYRLDDAGRLIIGSVGTVDHFAYGLHESWSRRTLSKTFPQVGEVPLEHGWHGTFAMNGDNVPRFHQLDENMFMITSFNGRGIGPGTVFGKLLAQFVIDRDLERMPLPLKPVETIKTRWFWNRFYETGARLYHLMQRRL